MERTEQEGFLVGAILGLGMAVAPVVVWAVSVVVLSLEQVPL